MILAAGLLVLAGLGLFVGGLATGTTDYYWACVVCCALAAVLLVAVRLRPAPRVAPAAERRAADQRTGPRSDGPGAGAPESAGSRPADADPTEDRPTGRHSRPAAEPPEDAPRAPAAGGPVTGDAGVPAEPVPAVPAVEPPETAAPSAGRPPVRAAAHDGDPAEEDVEVTDLLLVVDLRDRVLVVDEHPRYHLPGCSWLGGRPTVPIPVAEARGDGFTPCAVCAPDSHLADIARARRAAST